MKTILALAALLAVALAQQHHGHGDQHSELNKLIAHEVHAILDANAGISVDDCTSKCDAMFDLLADNDEKHTDDMCKHFCDCEINKTCNDHQQQPQPTGPAPSTHAPHTHPTHPPHPSHPPHPRHA